MEFMFALIGVLRQLRDFRERFAKMVPEMAFSGVGPQNSEFFLEVLEAARKQFRDFELDAAVDRVGRLEGVVRANCKLAEVVKEIEVLSEVAEDQLTRRHSVYVPLKKYEYFFKITALFPEAIQNAFPSVEGDAVDACVAYALNLNTACVYHVMGIVQGGLYALAHELKIPFTTAAHTSVELENWKNIIDQIESEIRKLESMQKGRQKDEKLSFYSRSAVQFRYFKDAWRNHVDHNRETYDADQAHSILIHARDFIKELAEHGLHDPQ